MKEVYVSIDIEADGPIPGLYSMLSFGAVAFTKDKILDEFSVNLLPLPGAAEDPDTMEFWKKNPEAWDACHQSQVPPEVAMQRFAKWSRDLGAKPVIVGYPCTFDHAFLYHYLVRFLGKNHPYTFSGLDIKSYAMAMLKTDFTSTAKRQMPKEWFKGAPKHNHVGLDDARGQAILFINMLKANSQ